MLRRPLAPVAIIALALLLSACGSLRYYAHVAHGEGALLLHRRPIAKVLRDPATDPALAKRLRLAEQARRFASARLGLPDNRSYTSYVDLHRPYVAWNVFATPPWSVEALPQCFPIAGCVAYRGYFALDLAQARARQLRAQGEDVWIGPVPAYSTLGWFADPIVSSMLRWDDDELAGTIFHELAHQLIYVKGDTAFNESFATFVQQQGLRQWRQARGLPPPDGRADAMEAGFTALVLDLRERLRRFYASTRDPAALARGKAREIAAFRQRYAAGASANGRATIATMPGWPRRSTTRGCCPLGCMTAGPARSRCCSSAPSGSGARSTPRCAHWLARRRPRAIRRWPRSATTPTPPRPRQPRPDPRSAWPHKRPIRRRLQHRWTCHGVPP